MGIVIVRIIDLPIGVKGMTVKDSEDDFNIYLNARYSGDIQADAFRHEIEHIKKGHFYVESPVWLKEREIDN